MATTAQIEASRRNGRLSRGPKTAAGKAKSVRNELKRGAFVRGPVVPALGESPEDWDAFRAAVVADLAPEGAVEHGLAVRVAELHWRLARIIRAEAAASSPDLTGLPPDPAMVGEAEPEVLFRPPVATAPVATRLAYVRRLLGNARRSAAIIKATIDQLADRPAGGGPETDFYLTSAIAQVAGWELDELAVRVKAVRAALGLDPDPLLPPPNGWTGELLRRVVTAAAGVVSVDPEKFCADVLAALAEEAAETDLLIAERESEQAELVNLMTADRERAVALRSLPPAGLSEQLVRVETHLGKQLDITLRQLDRLQARRRPAQPQMAVVVAGSGAALPPGFESENAGRILRGQSEVTPRFALLWPDRGPTRKRNGSRTGREPHRPTSGLKSSPGRGD